MTLVLIAITVIVSILSFNNSETHQKLLFNPYLTIRKKEWYRIISHGFVHADYIHLFFNMFVLYFFGSFIERYFEYLESMEVLSNPKIWFMLLYFAGMIAATLPTFVKHRDNAYYNSVGASGAVSAVLFCSIFFEPYQMVYIYGVIGIPGIVFGILYLAYSHYMSKKDMDNVNHDAHFAGAVFGFLFPIFINIELIYEFFDKILNPHFK